MNSPINKKLYEKVKREAQEKFARYPSAYASGWIVKTYKSRGGKYKGSPSPSSNLTRWYSEKWIDVCQLPKIVPCGRRKRSKSKSNNNYPYCRPLRKVTSKTPRTVNEIPKKELRRRCSIKQKAKKKTVIFV